ncbi:hypothetical protein PC9H_003008 [Pleurotus ostreatus]|uniref:DUF6533 domain-containing protein n=1 Tax=Pleurotus ostreatus TaxID=5322 RepID=A0A8H7A045_PLEOS|nr:uncharacterized protein PC9H_003008 [Pleurotus ostreatus]KAF7436182.1 hypothetical protein PC9H_003008 [Pleurotus ostreatus]
MEDYRDPLILQSLEGAEAARLLTIATFALLVYEWFITLDSEIQCFWRGGWSKSRMLFLANRYMTPIIILFPLYCKSCAMTLLPVSDSSSPSRFSDYNSYNCVVSKHPDAETRLTDSATSSCLRAIKACFILTVLVLGIVQAILVLRVYYLFSNSRLVQNIVIACFIVSVSISLAFACTASINLRPLQTLVAFGIRGCRAERPQGFWRLYLPPLVLHTLLYMFTVLRAVSNRQMLKKSPVMQRILKDGGFFYLITFVSVGFTAIGAFMEKTPHLNIPAIFSNFVLGITSVCVSRIMLSIQSLAAKLGSDTAWLLNNVELSRVRWRHGAHEGELIVDLEPAYEEEQDNQQDIEYNRRMYASDVELADIKSAKKSTGPQPQITVRTTRVGTFTDMNADKYYSQSVLTMKS